MKAETLSLHVNWFWIRIGKKGNISVTESMAKEREIKRRKTSQNVASLN